LALASAGADFLKDQVLAAVIISRYWPVAAGPGPAAIGIQDAQPEGLFRYQPCARVGDRVERALAPDELLITQSRMDGELEAVRVSQSVAHGNGYLIGAGKEQSNGSKPGDYTVWPPPGRVPGLSNRGGTRSGVSSKKLIHQLFPQSATNHADQRFGMVDTFRSVDSRVGVRSHSHRFVTSGDTTSVVRASPKNREVVHPCGSQCGSQATDGLRPGRFLIRSVRLSGATCVMPGDDARGARE
jgi:hypothetical protein